jgi:beta-glucanase (GH16 family)
MRKSYIIPWFFLMVFPFKSSTQHNVLTESAQKNEAFKLAWSDEFNLEGVPDTSKWDFEHGFVRNNEDQWYQKQNAYCLDGNLIITAKREHKLNPNFVEGSSSWKTNRKLIAYTSASLRQKKKFGFRYGKVLVRAKIIAQNGLWPAIWTLGVAGSWPTNGECDIMEYYKGGLHANFAHGGTFANKPIWSSKFKSITSFNKPNWDGDFHVWKLEWSEQSMEIYVDGLLLNSISLENTFNAGTNFNPFKQKHFILLNLALGGDNGGELVNTRFPSSYLIDYVRVFQKSEDAE